MMAEPVIIHPATRPGPVSLTIADLDRSLAFYTARLGLKLHGREASSARLGVGGEDLVRLVELIGARRARGTTGLYHFALLVPSRAELGRVLRHFVTTRTTLTGVADHLVSEALYLSDPDGNGIEVYRDRPRAEWTHDAGGLRMATDPLDVDGVLAEAGAEPPAGYRLPDGTVMGHIHLHVADLPAAEHFYRDLLGLKVQARFAPSASFLSAGEYHHHIAVNTWAGVGAPAPPEGALGLREFVMVLPDQAQIERIADVVRAAGLPAESTPAGLHLRDPSGNRLVIVAA
jgi:catechol 2,3-dioxygenase